MKYKLETDDWPALPEGSPSDEELLEMITTEAADRRARETAEESDSENDQGH